MDSEISTWLIVFPRFKDNVFLNIHILAVRKCRVHIHVIQVNPSSTSMPEGKFKKTEILI